jgi:two-component system sensor histidine kinase KdpD
MPLMPKASLLAAVDGPTGEAFEHAFLHAAIPMALLSLEGNFVRVNGPFCELVGRGESEIIGESWEVLTNRLDIPRQRRAVQRLLRHGPSMQLEKRYVHANGHAVWADVHATLVTDEHGHGLFLFEQPIDIGARKRAQATMRRELRRQEQTAERLRELHRLKSDFIAMAAHDLRSPIGGVAMGVRGLRRRWTEISDDRKLALIERIDDSLSAVTALVDDVLDAASIESGLVSLDLGPLDMAALARSTTKGLAADFGQARLRLSVEAGLPLACGDRLRQWQILSNLLSNAVKYSPSDTIVDVVVSGGGPMVHVRVRDRGAGIEPAECDRVFEPFARLRPKRLGEHERGTGLGLYICKALVEAQGGTIEVETTRGPGATLHYTVPAARSATDR